MTLLWALWLIVLGPVLASFTTAVAMRACAGGPMLLPRSRCACCGAALGWADLVPLWSYVRLGGRCRSCGGAIPRAAVLGEVSGLVAALLMLATQEGPVAQTLGVAWLCLLWGQGLADHLCRRLPHPLTFALLVAGLGLAAARGALIEGALAALVGAGAFWLIARGYLWLRGREGLGGGDINLIAGIAAAVGLAALPWVTLLAALLALAEAALRPGPDLATRRFPFGLYLALAAVPVWLVW